MHVLFYLVVSSEMQRNEHQLQQGIGTAREELRKREDRLRGSIGRVSSRFFYLSMKFSYPQRQFIIPHFPHPQ